MNLFGVTLTVGNLGSDTQHRFYGCGLRSVSLSWEDRLYRNLISYAMYKIITDVITH